MDKLPQELVDNILGHLTPAPTTTRTERVTSMNPEDRKDVLNARLVCHAFEKATKDQFVEVLGDRVHDLTDASLMTLRKIGSNPTFSRKMKRLTIGAFYARGPVAADKEVVKVLSKLPNVKHLIYAPMFPACNRGTWTQQDGEWLYYLSMTEIGKQGQAAWDMHRRSRSFLYMLSFLSILSKAGITLDTIETPLHGNQAPWSALGSIDVYQSYSIPKHFTNMAAVSNLTTMKINMEVESHSGTPAFPTDFLGTATLRKLEVAFSLKVNRLPQRLLHQVIRVTPLMLGKAKFQKLEEFNLQASTSCYFDPRDLKQFLARQPCLRRVGLAYVNLLPDLTHTRKENPWLYLLSRFDKYLDLELLRLINPTQVNLRRPTIYAHNKNDVTASFRMGAQNQLYNAAERVQVIYLDNPWSLHPNRAWLGVGFQYPGFSVFDQKEEFHSARDLRRIKGVTAAYDSDDDFHGWHQNDNGPWELTWRRRRPE